MRLRPRRGLRGKREGERLRPPPGATGGQHILQINTVFYWKDIEKFVSNQKAVL